MGVGALLIFIGVALFSPRLVRPLAGVLGWPAARIGGAAGRLARDNARRNPQRTASTAAALMIGLALVTLVATLAAGITSTFRGAVEDIFTSDYAITAQNNFSPIPTEAGEAAAKAPGVEAVASVRTGEARVFGDDRVRDRRRPGRGAGADARVEGGLAGGARRPGRERRLRRRRLRRGPRPARRLADHDRRSPTGNELELEVKGIFEPPAGGSPFGNVTFSSATFDRELRVAAEPLHVHPDARRRDRREHARRSRSR